MIVSVMIKTRRSHLKTKKEALIGVCNDAILNRVMYASKNWRTSSGVKLLVHYSSGYDHFRLNDRGLYTSVHFAGTLFVDEFISGCQDKNVVQKPS